MPRCVFGIPHNQQLIRIKSKALKGICAVLGGMALAALVAACGPSLGGPSGPEKEQARKAEQMADDMVNKLDKKTPLTFTKIAKVRAILLENYKKRPGPMGGKDGPPPPPDRGEKGDRGDRGDRGDKDAKGKPGQIGLLELELSLVLNEKEMAAYKELVREQKEEMKKHRPGKGPGGG